VKLILIAAVALAVLAIGVAYRHGILSRLRGAPADKHAGHDMQAMAQGQGEGAPPGGGMAQATVYLTPEKQQLIGVRTTTVKEESVLKTIRAAGVVEMDETRITHVHTRVSGWVRRVFVDFTWEHVHKGQPLFTLYSPELVSAQQEYLIARRGRDELASSTYPEVARNSDALLRAARERMKLWEMTDEQIAELEVSGTPREELTIYSPVSGHVSVRNVFPNQFITPESDLYTIVDHTHVWVQAQLYEYELESVRVGQPATMTVAAFPGRVFGGRVAYVNPHLEMMTRTLDVRLEFPNPDLALKPGMFADVTLEIPLGRRVVVPREAMLDTGTRQVVFLALPEGYFEPRQVELGPRLEDRVVILKGLEPGQTIVTSGAFLIDSESQLSAAFGGLQPPGVPTEPGPGAASEGEAAAQIDFSIQPSPPRVGRNELTVRLRDSSANPIADADVAVTFFMPAMPSMGMGAMQQRATLAHRGGGEYRGEIQVPERGNWRVTVTAGRQGETLASKQLNLVAQ
jgi:Cu(I)/Ag(I) efflux system membrane fusion protein/cobalt-zinc-cadmium efflux system membrane fusion protein